MKDVLKLYFIDSNVISGEIISLMERKQHSIAIFQLQNAVDRHQEEDLDKLKMLILLVNCAVNLGKTEKAEEALIQVTTMMKALMKKPDDLTHVEDDLKHLIDLLFDKKEYIQVS